MTFLNLAWSNLLRNRRRTASTLAAIGAGVCLVVITNGFTDGLSASLSDSLVNQIDGHLRIEHLDYKKFSISDQEKILIPDYRELEAEVRKIPHVRATMPRVVTGGLMSKGDKSTTFFGSISDIDALNVVLPDYGKNLVSGSRLAKDDPDGILVGRALAKSLDLNVGDELVLLSKTVHGEQSNALAHVSGIVTFPQNPDVEKSLVVAALGKSLKDNLLDLGNGATQLLVRLDDIANVPLVEAELNRMFRERGLPWHVVPWYESKSYSQMVGMFNGIASVIMVMLVLMVGVITSNALLMAFFERIRELGTLRAIGMRKSEIYHLLYTESVLVGLLGSLAGLAAGAICVLIAGKAGVPVGGFVNQEVYPAMSPASVMVSVAAPVAAILIAAVVPIHAATRMSVIESLNYQ